MNTEALRTFLILAEEQNFNKAAQRLFVVQSTVSARIQELEKELGQPLLDRSMRTMTITPAGERLIPLARKMLELEKELRSEAEAGRLARQRLTVGISDSIYYGYVESYLPEFLYSYPGISLSMVSRSSNDMLNMLRDDELDLCVSFQPGSDPGFESVPLCEDEIVLATTTKNREYIGGITPEELHEQNLFYSECFNITRELTQWRRQFLPDTLSFRLRTAVIYQLGSLLERTDAYAFLPRSYIHEQMEHHTLHVIPLKFDPPPLLRIYLTAKRAQFTSRKVQCFLKELMAHIQNEEHKT